VIRQRGKSTQVMVYAGRDPLTGRKRWVSRQVAGTGQTALKEASRSRRGCSPRSPPAATRRPGASRSPSWSTAGWSGARR
jgi:hypothetical protein